MHVLNAGEPLDGITSIEFQIRERAVVDANRVECLQMLELRSHDFRLKDVLFQVQGELLRNRDDWLLDNRDCPLKNSRSALAPRA